MNKNKLILIAVVLTLTIGVVAYFSIARNVNFTAIKAKLMFLVVTPEKHPEMYKIPSPFSEESESSSPVMTITNSAYSFSTPWICSESLVDSDIAIYMFTNGVKIIMGFDDASFTTGIDELDKEDQRKLREFLEERSIRSRLALYEAIIISTPKELSISLPKDDATLKLFLLTMKIATASVGTSELSFNYDNGRGFQMGDPESETHATLVLFDTPNDVKQIDIVWGENCNVTQQDLNCIIRSLNTNANQGIDPTSADAQSVVPED